MELEQTKRITYLIYGRLTETLSEQENEELNQWLGNDEQNRRFMENLTQHNYFSERRLEGKLYDSAAAFQKVENRYYKHQNHSRRWIYWGSAAAVLVLLIGSTLLFNLSGKQEQPAGAITTYLSAGQSRAILTLANGDQVKLGQHGVDSIMEYNGSRLKVTQDELEYRDSGNTVKPEYNILEVPRKGEFKLVLADGTKVWLNSESQIKYPVTFSKDERRVYLEGEAYFEVTENKNAPFIVDMGKACIQVLGTSFNAKAYKNEDDILATLTQGRIQLNSGEQSLTLQPEEQGIINIRTGELTKKSVDSHLYSGWKDGRFIFVEQTLEDIMNTLSRWYDIRIFFANASVRNITFSGNLKRYDSFDKITEMLEMTGVAHFKVNGNVILISE